MVIQCWSAITGISQLSGVMETSTSIARMPSPVDITFWCCCCVAVSARLVHQSTHKIRFWWESAPANVCFSWWWSGSNWSDIGAHSIEYFISILYYSWVFLVVKTKTSWTKSHPEVVCWTRARKFNKNKKFNLNSARSTECISDVHT